MKASTLLKWIGLLVVVALAYRGLPPRLVGDRPKVEQRVAQDRPDAEPGRRQRPAARRRRPLREGARLPAEDPDAGLLLLAQRRGDLRRAAQRDLPLRDASSARLTARTRSTPGAAPTTIPGISYINNRKPGELYIVGGEYPTLEDPNMAGPFVAKADAATGKQIWRTYVDNLNASGHWIGNANLNILDNGNIAFAWSNQIVLIDGDTRPDPEAQHAAQRRGADRRRQLQAPDDRARPHADPQGPDAADRLQAAGHGGDHQVRRGGHEAAELDPGGGEPRHARDPRPAAAARAVDRAARDHDVRGQDRHLHRL